MYIYMYWTAKETQMFVKIQFNHITTKNSLTFMITVSTSQNKIRAKCSLDICLSNCTVWYSLYTFLHTPPVSKTANVKTWLTFIQSNIEQFYLRFFCCSVYILVSWFKKSKHTCNKFYQHYQWCTFPLEGQHRHDQSRLSTGHGIGVLV